MTAAVCKAAARAVAEGFLLPVGAAALISAVQASAVLHWQDQICYYLYSCLRRYYLGGLKSKCNTRLVYWIASGGTFRRASQPL